MQPIERGGESPQWEDLGNLARDDDMEIEIPSTAFNDDPDHGTDGDNDQHPSRILLNRKEGFFEEYL